MPVRPPLNALHVFCAVARCGGVRSAAQQLSVTPGAVSRQLQTLETQLGETLFERGAASVTLTPAGRRLYQRIDGPMAAIVDALDAGRGARSAVVRVECGVTLAMHWLIPRLRSFAERHPRIEVQVRTADGAVDASAPVDVFIRRETDELRGLPARRFAGERAVLVAAASHPASAGLRGLARWPRIGPRSRPDLWPTWAAACGLAPADWAPTLEFDNTVLAIQAAAQGLGLAVLPEMFIDGLLQAGTLRCVQPRRVDSGAYFCAVGRQRDSARVRRFVEWLEGVD